MSTDAKLVVPGSKLTIFSFGLKLAKRAKCFNY